MLNDYLDGILDKTIVSLITAPINQNIALIRISGPKTYSVIKALFDRSLPFYSQKKSQLIFGNIVNEKKEVVDQVLLLCFYKPYSFTGEDVVEVSCHGNLLIVNEILNLILSKGISLANPGEFSKQAFFNDKLNLVQAQAINDLIRAPTFSATKLALHNLSSQAQKGLERLETKLLKIIANVEVNIDYPEYDGVEYITGKQVLLSLQELKSELRKIYVLGKQAKVYQEGIKVAIIGKPNVGKSTLLNALLKEKKAIVSSLAGTTRDVIEGQYSIKGIPLVLFDTAGIRVTENVIERIGVNLSQKVLREAEFVFFLLDNSRCWSKEDARILKLVKTKPTIFIVNKTDLSSRLKLPKDVRKFENVVMINAKAGQIQELENKIEQLLVKDLEKTYSPYPFLSQSWQQSKLKELNKKLQELIKALKAQVPLDIVSSDLQIAFRLLQELNGKNCQQDLLNVLFSKFCLGK